MFTIPQGGSINIKFLLSYTEASKGLVNGRSSLVNSGLHGVSMELWDHDVGGHRGQHPSSFFVTWSCCR